MLTISRFQNESTPRRLHVFRVGRNVGWRVRTCLSEGERKATIRLELATSDSTTQPLTRENIIAKYRAAIANVETDQHWQHGGALRRKGRSAKVDGHCFMQRQFSRPIKRTREKNTSWSEILSLKSRETTILGSS